MQRGEGKLGCLFWLALVLILCLIAWKTFPIKLNSSRLEDFMLEQARFSARRSAPQIQKDIADRAVELGLPVKRKDVSVQKTASKIRVHCTYTVPVEFPLYTYYWKFDVDIERPIFRF